MSTTTQKNLNVTYKDVTYDVQLINSTLFIGGSYICPFELDCIGFDDEKTLLEAVYDCIGGWVEGYEIYSLQANKMDNKTLEQLSEQLQQFESIVDYLNKESERFSKLRKQLIQTHSPQTDLTQYGLGAESVVNELLQILNK